MIFGAEVDAELERARQLRAGIHAEAQLQLPPRDSAASIKRLGKEQLLVAQGKHLRQRAQEEDEEPLHKTAEARTLWVVTGVGAVAAVVAAISRRRKRKLPRED